MFIPLCEYAENGRALYEYCRKNRIKAGYYYDLDAFNSRLDVVDKMLVPFFRILFSLKANPSSGLVGHIAVKSHFGADVSSENELNMAIEGGFLKEDVFFVGPGKSVGELQLAIELGIGSIVVESIYELDVINKIADIVGMKPHVILRINPSYEVHGVRMAMGGKHTQFGMNEADAERIFLNSAQLYPHVDVEGIHAYVGTRILDAGDALWNICRVLEFAEDMLKRGMNVRIVDVGGGLGIPYYTDERELDFSRFTDQLEVAVSDFPLVKQFCKIYMESGRFLTGPIGCFFAEVSEATRAGGEQNIEVLATPALHSLSHGGLLSRNKEFLGASLGESGWSEGGMSSTVWYRINGRRLRWPTRMRCREVSPNDFLVFLNSGAYGPSVRPVWENLEGYPPELVGSKGMIYRTGLPLGCMDLAGMQRLVLREG